MLTLMPWVFRPWHFFAWRGYPMMTEQLMEKITGGRAVCAVVGLGYVAFPWQ